MTSSFSARDRLRQHRLALLQQVRDFGGQLRALEAKLQNHSGNRFYRQFEPLYPTKPDQFRLGLMMGLAERLSDDPAYRAFEARWRVIIVPDLIVGGPLELGFIDDHFVLPVMLVNGAAELQWLLAQHRRAPDRFAVVDRRAVTNEVLEEIPRHMDTKGKRTDSREAPFSLDDDDLDRDPKIVAYCWPLRSSKIEFSELAARLEPELAKKLQYDAKLRRLSMTSAAKRVRGKLVDQYPLRDKWERLTKDLRERWPQLLKVLEFSSTTTSTAATTAATVSAAPPPAMPARGPRSTARTQARRARTAPTAASKQKP